MFLIIVTSITELNTLSLLWNRYQGF